MTDAGYVDHDGCRLHYAVRGAGPPVLFIQGVGVHGDGWLPQIEALAARYRCLRFDNRGLGLSQPNREQVTVPRMAEDAHALARAERWSSVHLVGHSLGGLVALRLALAHPGLVRSLSLLCTFARGRDAGSSLKVAWLGLRTRLGTRRQRREAFLEILAPRAVLDSADRARLAARLAPLFGHDLADHPPVEKRQLAALRAHDTTLDLPRLAGIPTLVVSAEHDVIAPPALGRSIAAGIPGARFVEVPGASHGLPILEAERVNGLLLEHLDDAEARRCHPSDSPLREP